MTHSENSTEECEVVCRSRVEEPIKGSYGRTNEEERLPRTRVKVTEKLSVRHGQLTTYGVLQRRDH